MDFECDVMIEIRRFYRTTDEIILDDSTRIAGQAEEAGVEVRLEIWEQMFHVFQMAGPIPEAKKAVASIARFVQRQIGSD